MNVLLELGGIIILATFLIFIARYFKQPYIPAYILAGIILGPEFGRWLFNNGIISQPGFITDLSLISEISEIGLAFLLFVVGLEISFKKLRDLGKVTIIGTIAQFILLFTGGYFLSKAFFPSLPSIYLALMLSFSSTMVVINILSKKNELDTLHGRIAIGTLLVQDFIAIIAITLLTGMPSGNESVWINFLAVLIAFLKTGILILLTFAASFYVFPKIFRFAAKSQELLLLSSISVAFFFSIFAENIGKILLFVLTLGGNQINEVMQGLISPGLSIAIGAFLGGVALASSDYSLEIQSKISPLKDFFATIFFVSLGIELVFKGFSMIIPYLLAFLLFLVFFKPIIFIIITGLFGFEKRTSFLTGITLFQVSEFGLIIVNLGYITGDLISREFFSMTVLLAAVTMIMTSYAIKYQNPLYNLIGQKISFLSTLTKKNEKLQYLPDNINKEVVLIGYNRTGFSIFKTLKKLKKNFLVLDYNPEVIKHLIKDKVHCIYGDANDVEILKRLHFKKAKTVISTITDYFTNELIIKKVKEENNKCLVFVMALNPKEALDLYDKGADYVVLPHYLGGDHVSFLLEDVSYDISKIVKKKFNHIQELHERHKNHHTL
ncbi:MAG: cation:proton antiporter [Nanobdellota archaeon]